MSQDGAEPAVELPVLKTHDAHSPGSVTVAWLASKEPGHLAVLTAGADGVLAERQLRPTAEVKWKTTISKDNPVNALAMSPDQIMAAVVVNRSHVKMLRLTGDINDVHDSKTIMKFTGLPTHCCAWGRDGKHVLAAGDDGNVRVALMPACKVMAQMKVEAFMRGAAMDPEGQYAAAATADGQLYVWDLKQIDQNRAKEELLPKKSITCKVDHDDAAALVGMAWHPEGTLLAVAGQDSDVLLLERLNWHRTAYLTGVHSGAVRVIAFSPNGLYVATGGEDGKVVVWLQDRQMWMQVAARQLPAPASSLAWHPSANMLLCGTTAGSFGIWPSTVPTDTEAALPSPYKAIDEVEREADVAAEKAAAAAAAAAGDEDSLVDDEDEEAGGAVIHRRVLKKVAGGDAGAAGGGGDDELADILDELDAAVQEAGTGAGRGVQQQARPYPFTGGHFAPKPKKPQGPIHPGSTPEEDGEGNEAGARFLAYNSLGAVVSKVGDGHNFIEVHFHDTSRHRGLAPKFTEMFGFSAASLGPQGVAYISPAAGEDRPSVLMYRAFESWSGEKEWMVTLPAGEEAMVVAAGSSVVAVATSKQLLRIYSLAGRQLSIVSLQGPPVALVAAGVGGDEVAAACEDQLAVVWAQGPPEPLHNTQQLSYTVFDASRSSQVATGVVVLSPGASLTWLAFSAEGLLAAMDSTGMMRVRTPDWGGCWVPVLDAAGAKESCGSDCVWPVCLAGGSLTAVATTKKAPYPQVLPAPLHTQVALSPPGAPAAEAAPAHEAQAILTGLTTAHVKSLASAGADVSGAANELEQDRLLLRTFNEYCKANKQARALEVAQDLHLVQCLEGAVKMATKLKLPRLAEAIQSIVNQRVEWEQQQEEEAAAAATAQQVQQDQASQFPGAATSSIKQPAAPNGQQQGGKVPAMFGGRSGAAAGGGSGGGGAASVKRTAGAAGFGSAAAAKGSNPFARKKAK